MRHDRLMYRVIVECDGIGSDDEAEAAADIEQEFREHRSWHQHAACSFCNGMLRLVVENDFDANGSATLDEFADSIAAYVGEHGPVRVVGVERF